MKREYMLRATLFGLRESFFVLTIGTLLFSAIDSDLQKSNGIDIEDHTIH
jgi:hypothetical protein